MTMFGVALLLSIVLQISPVVSVPGKDLDFLVARFLLAHSWP